MKLRTPGEFGHTFAISGNPDETALFLSRLIRSFAICFVDFFISINYNMDQTRSLSEFT